MDYSQALKRFETFVTDLEIEGLHVQRVSLALDERLDGEEVTRVLLLVDDPAGETWDLEAVTRLRHGLARFATQLGLPSVSISLVPEREADLVPSFGVR